MTAESWATVARFFALAGVLVAVFVFATGSKWWRNKSLRATFYLFMSILLVLLHGLVSGSHWYPAEYRLTIITVQWFLIGGVFFLWSVSFIREQFRPHPVRHNRRHDDPKEGVPSRPDVRWPNGE